MEKWSQKTILRLEKWIEKLKFAVFDDVGFVYIHHLMCVLNKVANVLLHSYFCVNNIPIFGKLVPETKVSKTYIVCLFIF